MTAHRGTIRAGRRVLVGLLLAFLAACRVGPDYHTPALPSGATAPLVSLHQPAETASAPPDAWWQLYNDSRLDALVEEAFNANRTLGAATANIGAARALLAAAQANRYPSTSALASATYGRDGITDEILELGGRPPQTIWLFEELFESAYEVDLFGRVHRSIEVAHANADSVAAARDSVKVVVAAETIRAYATICALGEELEVARHSLEVVDHLAQITVQRHEAGANSVFDVLRSQALVAQVRAGIPEIEGERRSALFEISAILGRTPSEAPIDLESCIAPPRLDVPIPVGDGADLLRRRPDVRQAERQLAAATAQIGVATADLYPTIRLLGLYGGVASEVSLVNANAGRTWGIGPSISWSFPNMAGPRARVRQAKAAQAAALASFDSVVLTALEETERALALYNAALEGRQSLLEARDKIHEALKIGRDQYLAGAQSHIDLLTTEQSLVELDAAVASSDAGLVMSQIAVFKALGGGWRVRNSN